MNPPPMRRRTLFDQLLRGLNIAGSKRTEEQLASGVVVLVVALAFTLGLAGWFEHGRSTSTPMPTSTALYRTLLLFVLDSSDVRDPPVALDIARFLAPFATVLVTTALWLRAVRARLVALAARWARGHVVIVGSTTASPPARGSRVVHGHIGPVLEEDPAGLDIAIDPSTAAWIDDLGVPRAQLLILGVDDETNLRFLQHLIEATAPGGRLATRSAADHLDVRLEVHDAALAGWLAPHVESLPDVLRVDVIDRTWNIVRSALRHSEALTGTAPRRFVIAGTGPLLDSVLLQLLHESRAQAIRNPAAPRPELVLVDCVPGPRAANHLFAARQRVEVTDVPSADLVRGSHDVAFALDADPQRSLVHSVELAGRRVAPRVHRSQPGALPLEIHPLDSPGTVGPALSVFEVIANTRLDDALDRQLIDETTATSWRADMVRASRSVLGALADLGFVVGRMETGGDVVLPWSAARELTALDHEAFTETWSRDTGTEHVGAQLLLLPFWCRTAGLSISHERTPRLPPASRELASVDVALLREAATALHVVYQAIHTPGRPAPDFAERRREAAWSQASPDDKAQSLDNVRHNLVALAALGAVPDPAGGRLDIEWFADDLTTLAILEHDRWLEQKAVQRYRWAPERTPKDYLGPDLRHSDMEEWAALDENAGRDGQLGTGSIDYALLQALPDVYEVAGIRFRRLR